MTKLRAKSAKEDAHTAATEQHRRAMANLQKTRNAELEVRRARVAWLHDPWIAPGLHFFICIGVTNWQDGHEAENRSGPM